MLRDRIVKTLGALLFTLSIAFVANAATPRAVCACTTKEKMYQATMRADLRNLVTAQEAFFTESSRYASSLVELDSSKFLLSRGVVMESLSGTAAGFTARVRYPSGTPEACWIAVGQLPDGSVNEYDGEPRCDPPPRAMYPIIAGGIYFALLLLAIFIRFARSGRGLPPISVGTAGRFAALFLIHPYWPHDRRDMSCYSNAEALEAGWVIMIAVICLWMTVRRVKSWEPPQAA